MVEIVVNDLLANGQAVGRADGVVVFVWGPLPGERVRVRIVECKARYVLAELVETLTVSPDRVEPFCGVFGTCGGCQIQHLAYPAQLRWKQAVVRAALERIGSLALPEIQATVGMEHPRAYRNKMALVVSHEGAKPELGFYQARSHELVPIDDCPIVTAPLQADLHQFRQLLHEPAGQALFADVAHVVVRRTRQDESGVIALTTAHPSKAVARGAELLQQRCKRLLGVSNSFDLASANVILGRGNRVVVGTDQLEEEVGELRFRVSVQSFFQVNVAMVEQIFARLRGRIQPGLRIIDLYCGAGTFAVLFAKLGAQVIGFEENARAIDEAHENAQLNGVAERSSFVVGRVETLVRGAIGQKALANSDIAFLDPPRKGSDEVTLRAIIASPVREIWYLSCNPATLARDCALLATGGFVLEYVQPFDMFPQTGHVEVLTTLKRTQGSSEASA